MKKLISGLMLFVFALTLTSCIDMNSQTTLSFRELPDAVIAYDEDEPYLNPKEIVVLIDGKAYALDAAEKIGAIVEGDEYDLGYNTLLVTYNNVTISFTYLVQAPLPEVYDISWYDPDEALFIIETAAELRGLAQLVNNGYKAPEAKEAVPADFAGKTVKLGADIDLAGHAWTPIGEGARKIAGEHEFYDPTYTFQGTFDGGNHVISNLTDAGYVPVVKDPYENTIITNVYGYVYGLFGMVNAGGVTIKNVVLEDVQINGVAFIGNQAYVGDSIGGIIGYCGVSKNNDQVITISNCHVSGEIAGYDAIAGIAGRLYSGVYVIDNCVNEANLTGTRGDGKVGGMVAHISFSDATPTDLTDLTIKNSQNKGEITVPQGATKSDYLAAWNVHCAYKCADDPKAPNPEA